MKENISYQKLPRSFYLDDTVNVAKKLIGKLLVREIDGETLSAIICETEAYTGFSDKACHSYKGKSERTKVLDCGCGGGANIKRLLKKCPQGIVKGIDYSPVSVEKSKKVNDVAIAEGRCAVLQGSVADMMFTDNWFDAVTAFETVYFWPDLPRCFREVYRVLKVGGTFLICNEANGDTDKDERWTEIIGGMTIYKDTELKAYLEQAGFHEVRIHKKKGWLCVSAQK